MRSLALKLVLAFLIVSLTGAALTAAFARWCTQREFDRLVREQTEASLVSSLAAYYEAAGSWKGVTADPSRRQAPSFQTLPPKQDGGRPGPDGSKQPSPSDSFVLVDSNRTVIVAAAGYQVGDRVPEGSLGKETPVQVGGRTVGSVLVTGRPIPLDP